MENGMATKKITITLDEEQLEAVKQVVGSGGAPSVSSFVQHAVGVALNDVAGWSQALGLALERTGGVLTKRERAWADEILEPRARKRARRAA
jgi:Arc/MetJ-type ribon-helix-helix transcriptional regulator